MLEYLLLLLSLARSAVRDREALVAENLLLRHQLAVLTRPTRKRPRLRARDKLFWVVVRALRGDWRRHLAAPVSSVSSRLRVESARVPRSSLMVWASPAGSSSTPHSA